MHATRFAPIELLMTQKLPIFIVSILLVGCANPYTIYYNDKIGGRDVTKIPCFTISTKPPVILRGNDPDTDYQTMFGDGFRAIGYVIFNGKEAPSWQIIQQAKTVKAERVLVYEKYTNTDHLAVPLTLPNSTTITTHYNSYGSYGGSYGFGFGFSGGTASTTVDGTTTTVVPVSVRRYDQGATFWVRTIPNPILGIDARDLTPQQKNDLQTNRGVTVFAVQKDTPAYDADILKGDIIKSLASVEVTDINKLSQLNQQFAGRHVKIDLIRNGNPISKEVKLNPIPACASTSLKPVQ